MTEEEKRLDEESRRAVSNPQPPDDPDQDSDEWVFYEKGKQVPIKRPSRFKKWMKRNS